MLVLVLVLALALALALPVASHELPLYHSSYLGLLIEYVAGTSVSHG